MPHKRSPVARKRRLEKRLQRHQFKLELRRALSQAFYDRDHAELVSLEVNKPLDIVRGEVLQNPRYVRVFKDQ